MAANAAQVRRGYAWVYVKYAPKDSQSAVRTVTAVVFRCNMRAKLTFTDFL